MTIEGIVSKVAEIRSRTGNASLSEICEQLGICLQYFPMGSDPDACKGFFIMRFEVPCITVNQDLSLRNQEIILAHELGHACLHEYLSELSDFETISKYGMNDICEYEANLFAAELMISDESLLELLEQGYTAGDAASLLAVPPELVDFKMRILERKGYPLRPVYAPSNFMKGVAG